MFGMADFMGGQGFTVRTGAILHLSEFDFVHLVFGRCRQGEGHGVPDLIWRRSVVANGRGGWVQVITSGVLRPVRAVTPAMASVARTTCARAVWVSIP